MRLPWRRDRLSADDLSKAHKRFLTLVNMRTSDRSEPSAGEVEAAMRMIDAGALDALLEEWAPRASDSVPVEHYSDVRPFSYSDWMRRHNVPE
jgi:hypothetical protein